MSSTMVLWLEKYGGQEINEILAQVHLTVELISYFSTGFIIGTHTEKMEIPYTCSLNVEFQSQLCLPSLFFGAIRA